MDQKQSQILLGLTEEHLCSNGEYTGVLHAGVAAPFAELIEKAKKAGFDIRVISGYRSFERQLKIWNAKARGERPVIDDRDCAVQIEALNDLAKIEAIMRFSALPGASRHHWGTDFDIYDAAAIEQGYQVQLTVSETKNGGVFSHVHKWLDEQLPETDFYRPYQFDSGGVSIEPWHLSYRPISDSYEKIITPEILLNTYKQVEIELFDCIEQNIEMLFERFVQVH